MPEYEQELKVLAKGGGLILLGLFISKLLGYAYRIAVARIGPEEYGLISLGIAIVGFFGILGAFGLDSAVLRYIPFYNEKKDFKKLKGLIRFVLNFSLIISILAGVCIFLLSDPIALFLFHDIRLSLVLKILAISIPFASLSNLMVNVVKGFKDVRSEIVSKNIVENVIKVALTFIFIYMGWSYLGAAAAYAAGLIASTIIAYFFLKKYANKFKEIKVIFVNKEILTYSWPLLFNSFLMVLLCWVDTWMLGFFKSASEVGIYNAAMPTAMLMSVFPKALVTLFLPIITTLYVKKEMTNFKIMYQAISKWILFLNVLLLALFIVFPQQILNILFGFDYIGGGFSLTILSIGFFFSGLAVYSSRDILMLFKKTKTVLYITISSVVLDIVLNYLLIPRYSYNGASIATGASFIFMALMFFISSHSKVKIWPFKLGYLKIVLSASIALGVIYWLSNYVPTDSLIVLILLLIILVIVYFGLLLITKSFERSDITIIRSLQRKMGLNIPFIDNILRRFI